MDILTDHLFMINFNVESAYITNIILGLNCCIINAVIFCKLDDKTFCIFNYMNT